MQDDSRAAWNLTGETASLRCGELTAVCPLGELAGFRDVHLTAAQASSTLFRVVPIDADGSAVSLSLREAYVRGNDLVASYAPHASFPFSLQTYQTAAVLGDGHSVALSLTLSLQTDLLDTRPRVELLSTLLTHGRSLESGAAINTERSVITTPHPDDAAETATRIDGPTVIHRFEPPFLEKGVIRRARFAAILYPAAPNDDTLRADLESLHVEPLPLTA